MSLKLSQIPVAAAVLARTDLMYVAADLGGGVYSERHMPVPVIGESAFNFNGIGITPTATLYLNNTTDATAGLQQNSPAIFFSGRGFATTPVQSMNTAWVAFSEQLVGAAIPTSQLVFQNSIDGAALATKVRFTNLGQIFAQASINTVTNVNAMGAVNAGTEVTAQTQMTVLSTGKYAFLGRTILGANAVGSLSIYDSSFSGIGSINLGGDTSAFPRLERSGNILEILGADGASMADLAVYNTKTSTVSFERLDIFWTANVAQLWTEKGSGGGTARPLVLGADGTELMRFGSATTLSFFAVAPVARQVVPTGSTTDAVITALQNLGLFSQT